MTPRTFLSIAASVVISTPALGQGASESIRIGQELSGSLSARDPRSSDGKLFRVYRFEGDSGKRYLVTLHSNDFDPYLRIGKSIAGITDYIATDDDSGTGNDAQINLRSTQRTSYVIVVTSSADTAAKGGVFTLLVRESVDHPVSIRAIAIGDSAVGVFDENSATWRNTEFPYAVYTFRVQKGETTVAQLRGDSGTVDVDFGRMTNGSYSPLAGSSGVARVRSFTATDDGDYAVRVMAARPTRYVLHVMKPAPQPVRTVQIGRDLSGILDAKVGGSSQSFHEWILHGDRNERVSISLTSRDFNPMVVLNRHDADTVVRLASNSRGSSPKIDVSLPVTGEYQIWVEALDAVGGSYTLRVDTLARIQRRFQRSAIASGQQVNGTLSESDSTLDDGSPFQEWTFQVTQPKERVVFTMRSNEFDTFLSVGQIENGKFVEFSSNDDAPGDTTDHHVSRVMIVAPTAGTFVIRANSMAMNQRGGYTLRAGPPATEDKIANAINTAYRAQALARKLMIAQAAAALDSALAMDSAYVGNQELNTVCWFGALQNSASRVLSYCERAVRLDPNNTGIRDSRGVARALTGNIAGAIEDFSAYGKDESNNSTSRNQRKAWVAALQAGTSPQQVFSEAVRNDLLKQ